jgi:hypothetical protein
LRADLSQQQADPVIDISGRALDDFDQLVHLSSQAREEGVAFYPARDPLLQGGARVYVFLDSAGPPMIRTGRTSVIDKADTSVRGGFAYVVRYNLDGSMAPETYWSFTPWPKRRFLWALCSTTLEAMNANMTIDALLSDPGAFGITDEHVFVEVLDNLNSARQLRFLSCKAEENFDTLAERTALLRRLGESQQIYTAWLNRELGSLADMGSKGLLEPFLEGLRARGFPPPSERPFDRTLPLLTGDFVRARGVCESGLLQQPTTRQRDSGFLFLRGSGQGLTLGRCTGTEPY